MIKYLLIVAITQNIFCAENSRQTLHAAMLEVAREMLKCNNTQEANKYFEYIAKQTYDKNAQAAAISYLNCTAKEKYYRALHYCSLNKFDFALPLLIDVSNKNNNKYNQQEAFFKISMIYRIKGEHKLADEYLSKAMQD